MAKKLIKQKNNRKGRLSWPQFLVFILFSTVCYVANAQYETTDEYLLLETVGREDSMCGPCSAWLTHQLATLLTANPTISIKDIALRVGRSTANRQNLKEFVKEGTDHLVELERKEETSAKVKKSIREGKEFAEQVVEWGKKDYSERLNGVELETALAELETRKYVKMTVPHGQLMVEMLKHKSTPLENVVVYLDGLGSNLDEEIEIYNGRINKNQCFSPRVFVGTTRQMINERIRKNGDFIIFTFSGEFSGSFSCWIVLCVRQIDDHMQFLILDPANSSHYSKENQAYFPGLIYQNYNAGRRGSECFFCGLQPENPIVLPCCNGVLCASCLTNLLQRQRAKGEVLRCYQCDNEGCSKFLPLDYQRFYNPRLGFLVSSGADELMLREVTCRIDALLKSPEFPKALSKALKDLTEGDFSSLDELIRNWWEVLEQGNWHSFVTLLERAKQIDFFNALRSQIDRVVELIENINREVTQKAGDFKDSTIAFLELLHCKGATLQSIYEWIRKQSELRGEPLKEAVQNMNEKAKALSGTRPSTSLSAVDQLLMTAA